MSVLDIKLDRSFDVFDSDRDGRLEKSDVTGLSDRLAESLGVAPTVVAGLRNSLEDLWDAVFQKMDKNDDGGSTGRSSGRRSGRGSSRTRTGSGNGSGT